MRWSSFGFLDTMSPRGARIAALVLAIALGRFLYLRAREAWMNYWLLADAQKGTALVTNELWSGHNAVGYQYTVNGKEYTGQGHRNWDDPKYRNVQAGQESVVYFSASHPWLSQLTMPCGILPGTPVVRSYGMQIYREWINLSDTKL